MALWEFGVYVGVIEDKVRRLKRMELSGVGYFWVWGRGSWVLLCTED